MQVAIIGSGPSGLVLAAALRRRGVAATIYERVTGPEQLHAGAAVNLMQPALRVLRDEGLLAAVARCNAPSTHFYFHDAGAGVALRAVDLAARYGEPYLTVRRGDATAALLAALPGAAPRFGKSVVGVATAAGGGEDDDGRVRVRFDDGAVSEERFEVVAGCDGIHSLLRSHVVAGHSEHSGGGAAASNASNASNNASAVVNLIGVAGPLALLTAASPALAAALAQRPAFTVYLDPAVTLLLAPVAADSVMFCVVASKEHFPESSGGGGGGGGDSGGDLRGALRDFLRACTPPPSAFVVEVVEACLAHTPADNADALRLWRCRDTAPLRSFVRCRRHGGDGDGDGGDDGALGNVALVGDAAHAALPWTGLGISAAALDAQRLADALAAVNDEANPARVGGDDDDGGNGGGARAARPRPGAVAAALERYDADRRPRGHVVQRAARVSDGGQGPSAYGIGRRVLRVLPLKLVYGVQDALVRDAGGEVLDACECRTAEAQLFVNAAMAVVAAVFVVFIARIFF